MGAAMGMAEVLAALRADAETVSRLSPTERAAAVNLIGRGPVEWAARATESSMQVLHAMEPSDALFPVDEVGRACERVLVALLTELATGEPLTRDPELYRHPMIVNDIVTRDIGLLDVVAAMRLVQDHWIHLFIQHADHVRASGDVVERLVQVVTASWDLFMATYVESYLIEHERFVNTASARGREIVESLIAGEPVSGRLARSRLGISLQDQHMALVVVARGRLKVAPEALSAFTASVALTLGAHSVVRYQTTDGALWSWVTTPIPLKEAALALVSAPQSPLVVGIGSPHWGASGFRRTHLEARDATRLSLAGHRDLVRFDDFPLLAHVTNDLERAGWFVARELGPLAEISPVTNELRATLSAFFAARMRLASAAAELHMHRNTLIHRIQRIEKLIGHPVTDRAVEMQCALLILAELGESVVVPTRKDVAIAREQK